MLNDFKKPPEPEIFYMPVWTVAEMEAIAPFFPGFSSEPLHVACTNYSQWQRNRCLDPYGRRISNHIMEKTWPEMHLKRITKTWKWSSLKILGIRFNVSERRLNNTSCAFLIHTRDPRVLLNKSYWFFEAINSSIKEILIGTCEIVSTL